MEDQKKLLPSEILAEKIENIMQERDDKLFEVSNNENISDKSGIFSMSELTKAKQEIKSSARKKIKSLKMTFPIPNEKEALIDYIEFLSADDYNMNVDRIGECLNKAKQKFPNDELFNSAIERYDDYRAKEKEAAAKRKAELEELKEKNKMTPEELAHNTKVEKRLKLIKILGFIFCIVAIICEVIFYKFSIFLILLTIIGSYLLFRALHKLLDTSIVKQNVPEF